MAKKIRNEKDYEVGYGKPPTDKQFKKGRSGNPKGRPKGSKNMSTHIEEVLASKVMVRENGISRMLPFRKVFVRNLAAKALNGTVRDMLSTMSAIETYAPQELEQKPYPDKLTVQYVLPDGKTMEDYEQGDTHARASSFDPYGSRVHEASDDRTDAAWRASGIDNEPDKALDE